MEQVTLVLGVAGATVVWRTLIDDHPNFRRAVCRIPLLGQSLVCGVCVSYWFSLVALVFAGTATLSFAGVIYWLALGTAVLFTRSVVLATLDGAAILKHKHLHSHR